MKAVALLAKKGGPKSKSARRSAGGVMAAPAEPLAAMSINLKEAKDQLSRLVHETALGRDFTITINGHPAARLISSEKKTKKVFKVNWLALRRQPKPRGWSSTKTIREERDGEDLLG